MDPRSWTEDLASTGHLTSDQAAWLTWVLDRLAPAVLAGHRLSLCHGDINAANVLVSPDARTYRAVIDWAGADWLDPVWDFVGVNVHAVPFMLDGHRQEAPLIADETAEACILWCRIQDGLHQLRQQPGEPSASSPRVRRLLQHSAWFLPYTER